MWFPLLSTYLLKKFSILGNILDRFQQWYLNLHFLKQISGIIKIVFKFSFIWVWISSLWGGTTTIFLTPFSLTILCGGNTQFGEVVTWYSSPLETFGSLSLTYLSTCSLTSPLPSSCTLVISIGPSLFYFSSTIIGEGLSSLHRTIVFQNLQ